MADRAYAPKKRPMKYPMAVQAPVQEDSDHDSDSSDEEVEEEVQPKQLSKGKRPMPLSGPPPVSKGKRPMPLSAPPPVTKGKRPMPLSAPAAESDEEEDSEEDEDESEEEEESEDEEEEEEVLDKRPKKKARPAANPFIEMEADVDSDDSEEDGDYGEDVYEDDGEREEAIKIREEVYRDLDRKNEENADQDAEDIVRRIQERHQPGAYSSATAYAGDAGNVPMQFLLPSAKDPNLWLVRCKIGRERDIAFNLMRKYLQYQGSETPLNIKSVIARDGLKGYIYVEARSQSDVQRAIDKMNNIYASKITLIPVEEMVDVLTVKQRVTGLKPGSWVRMKRGKYKGDLAQVVMASGGETIEIKLVPRLDFGEKPSKEDRKRKVTARPAQRFFNQKDVPSGDRTLTRSQGLWVWGNDRFDKQGFLVRDIKLDSLITENVKPTLDELSKFTNDQDGDERFNMAALDVVESKANEYLSGDAVVIIHGDLINATGVVKKVEKNLVIVTMDDPDLGDVEIEGRKLARAFRVGDHVMVVKGKHKDEAGMITQVKKNVVTIYSDTSKQQFDVFLSDIRTSAEVSITENVQKSYAVNDFVQLGSNSVAVVLKVEKDQFRIIDQTGTVKNVKLPEIIQKRDSKNAIALDANHRALHSGEVVEILYGEHANKQATILHLFRSFAFCTSKDVIDNNGVFVMRCNAIRFSSQSSSNVTQAGAGAPSFQAPAQLLAMRKQLLHKDVFITMGPYKGYQAFVKEMSEKGARVQLNTNAKKITIDPSKLRLKEEMSNGRPSYERNRFAGGTTPMVGSRTPAVMPGGSSSSYNGMGARTPAWDAGARTPAWDAGSRTPALGFGGESSFGAFRSDTVDQQPFNGQAAGASNDASGEYGNNWLIVNIEVRFRDGQFRDDIGYVADVMDSGKTGAVVIGKQKVTVSSSHLLPVAPSKKDPCVFLTGEYKGSRGTLIGIESEDAIVKLDSNAEFKMANLTHVCKLHS